MKLPHIQLYPGDWLKDPISGCSLEAQGLWLRLMFVMHDSSPRGCLCQPDDSVCLEFCLSKNTIKNGASLKPLLDDYLARRVGASVDQFRELMKELWSVKVPSKTENGVIYSRRIVRDEQLRRIRAKAGSKGGKVSLARVFAQAKPQANTEQVHDNDNDSSTSVQKGGIGGNIEPPVGFPKSEEEAIQIGSMIGVAPEICQLHYNLALSRNYTDSKGQPIARFPNFLKAAAAMNTSARAERGIPAPRPKSTSTPVNGF